MKCKRIILSISILAISLVTNAQAVKLKLTVNNSTEMTATMVENSSVEALIELLQNGPLTVAMNDYGSMEKVGSLGTTLPRNDEQITTEPGDIILYQGSALVIYYAQNSWNFTRLGKIDDLSQDELKSILGTGSVLVSLELIDTGTRTKQLMDEVAKFTICPNPVNDEFKIEGPMKSATMMDANGRIVMETTNAFVNIRDLNAGVYFLEITSEKNRTSLHKIIKTH